MNLTIHWKVNGGEGQGNMLYPPQYQIHYTFFQFCTRDCLKGQCHLFTSSGGLEGLHSDHKQALLKCQVNKHHKMQVMAPIPQNNIITLHKVWVWFQTNKTLTVMDNSMFSKHAKRDLAPQWTRLAQLTWLSYHHRGLVSRLVVASRGVLLIPSMVPNRDIATRLLTLSHWVEEPINAGQLVTSQ